MNSLAPGIILEMSAGGLALPSSEENEGFQREMSHSDRGFQGDSCGEMSHIEVLLDREKWRER